eukprot:Opistho-1_new@14799
MRLRPVMYHRRRKLKRGRLPDSTRPTCNSRSFFFPPGNDIADKLRLARRVLRPRDFRHEQEEPATRWRAHAEFVRNRGAELRNCCGRIEAGRVVTSVRQQDVDGKRPRAVLRVGQDDREHFEARRAEEPLLLQLLSACNLLLAVQCVLSATSALRSARLEPRLEVRKKVTRREHHADHSGQQMPRLDGVARALVAVARRLLQQLAERLVPQLAPRLHALDDALAERHVIIDGVRIHRNRRVQLQRLEQLDGLVLEQPSRQRSERRRQRLVRKRKGSAPFECSDDAVGVLFHVGQNSLRLCANLVVGRIAGAHNVVHPAVLVLLRLGDHEVRGVARVDPKTEPLLAVVLVVRVVLRVAVLDGRVLEKYLADRVRVGRVAVVIEDASLQHKPARARYAPLDLAQPPGRQRRVLRLRWLHRRRSLNEVLEHAEPRLHLVDAIGRHVVCAARRRDFERVVLRHGVRVGGTNSAKAREGNLPEWVGALVVLLLALEVEQRAVLKHKPPPLPRLDLPAALREVAGLFKGILLHLLRRVDAHSLQPPPRIRALAWTTSEALVLGIRM